MLSPDEIREIDEEAARLALRRSAVIEALRVVQRHRGWISDEAVADLALHLGLSGADVDSVATFYSFVFRRPVGRHVILLCDSVSCWIMGCGALRDHFRVRRGLRPGETSADGRFTLLPAACLGLCERAPALLVDGEAHGDVAPGAIDALLERYP